MALSKEFNEQLGQFHYNWSAADIHVDYAIYKFLEVTPLQAHLITTGMMFGRKIRLLVDLIKNGEHDKKAELLAALGRIQGANRDLIAHAWVRSDASTVTFLERKPSGKNGAVEHTFTLAEFTARVAEVTSAGTELRQLLNIQSADLDEFAKAALSARRS